MRILLTETDAGLADEAARTFESADHEVTRCSPVAGTAFPCAGLADDQCPLDDGVDVVVAVRPPDHPEPSAREMGVTCALRRRLPVVVAGADGAPFAGWVSAMVPTDHGPELLATVEAIAGGGAPPHAAVAAEVVEARLGLLGIEAEALRQGGRLRVTIHVPAGIDNRERENLAAQVAGAVRGFDRWVEIIDVTVLGPEA